MLTPETILQGRYRIIRQLGQGGMGAVYEAVDTRLDTTVALKETLFTDERLRKQFEREARLLARLHHPALPRVSDHFAEGDGEFLVMQFIAGDDLAEMVTRRNTPFPTDQVSTWADQLLDALDYLHTQTPQIIHRDIKPQNLKLTSRGQIILLDFGLAKGQVAEVSRVSTASIFGYTPNYAPLEQIQGLGTDARSDIYALAATLYHLMTGVKPADALTRAAAVVNSQPDPLKRANEVNGNIAASIAYILEKALAQNRDQRYASAAEMRRALQQSVGVTVANRSEADTVLFPSSRSSASAETKASILQPTVPAGETTVLRTHSQPRRMAWALPVAAVVLVLAIAGGFYAYRSRFNSAEVSQPPADAQPSPTVQNQQNSTEASASAEVPEETKEVEIEKEKVEADERAIKKQEQAAQKQRESVKRAEDQGTRRDQDVPRPGDIQVDPDVPETPNVQPPEVPLGRPTETVVPDGTRIRHFPDGTQMIIHPDGRRVVIRPDGTRYVIRPGQRVPRRVLRRP